VNDETRAAHDGVHQNGAALVVCDEHPSDSPHLEGCNCVNPRPPRPWRDWTDDELRSFFVRSDRGYFPWYIESAVTNRHRPTMAADIDEEMAKHGL